MEMTQSGCHRRSQTDKQVRYVPLAVSTQLNKRKKFFFFFFFLNRSKLNTRANVFSRGVVFVWKPLTNDE